jgi:hypothetical protein
MSLAVKNDFTRLWRLGLIYQMTVITCLRTHTIADIFRRHKASCLELNPISPQNVISVHFFL